MAAPNLPKLIKQSLADILRRRGSQAMGNAPCRSKNTNLRPRSGVSGMALLSASHQLRQANRCLYASLGRFHGYTSPSG